MAERPRCFVAIAVGHSDTDRFYERLLKPVLKRNGILPIVISARESNDDLNNQIVEQLNQCDLCVADLTYARQSVYFEAGYAQRAIPVIYTVRRDHLGKNQPEDQRVHFDLAMKPLVPWSGPGDLSFRMRFERRLRGTFLKEWKRRTRADAKLDGARRAFGSLSVGERVLAVRRLAIGALKTQAFRPVELFPPSTYERGQEPTGEELVRSVSRSGQVKAKTARQQS